MKYLFCLFWFISTAIYADDDLFAVFDNVPSDQKRVISTDKNGYKQYAYCKVSLQDSTRGLALGVSEKEWNLSKEHYIEIKDGQTKNLLKGQTVIFYAYQKKNKSIYYNISPAFSYHEDRFYYNPSIVNLEPGNYLFHVYIKDKEELYNTDFEINVVTD